MTKKEPDKMEKLVSLAKRRGFAFSACEIYGGMANSYAFGPYGTQLKNNIKKLWWHMFVESRTDMVGLDGPILLNPKLWHASGHTKGFNDAMVDCKECKKRFRADHLVEKATGKDMEGDLVGMNNVLKQEDIKCPECGKTNWTEAKNFNMMFSTQMNGIDEPVFLRPETAGAIFVEFKNILDSMRVKIPFGIAQIGKAFRNEVVAGNFIFRVREFEQMEIEYFIEPKAKWEKMFDEWLEAQKNFVYALGVDKKEITTYEHPKEKLAFYSKKTVDINYNYPFGNEELFGLAYRTDYDLSSHSKASDQKLDYMDPETKEKYIPHVIEPTFGLDRSLLATLLSAYSEEEIDGETRVVMKFPKNLAPVQVAVFPLLRNKEKLVEKAKEVFESLKDKFVCEFDDNGNIGKRYRRQDEIGTPFCVTIDFDTIEKDNTVTVRDRDTMKQERVEIEKLEEYLQQKMNS